MESTLNQNNKDDRDRETKRQRKNWKAREKRKETKWLDEELRHVFEENEKKIKELEKVEGKLSSELINKRR